MLKKGVLVLLLYILIVQVAIAPGGTPGSAQEAQTGTGDTVATDNPDTANTALSGGKTVEYNGMTISGSSAKVNSDGSVTCTSECTIDKQRFSGQNIKKENGVLNAGEIKDSQNEGRTVNGMTYTDPNTYTINSADYWKTPDHIIVDGKNIKKEGNCLSVGSAQTLQRVSVVSSELTKYENCGKEITVDSAKVVVVDNIFFNDISNSTFVVDESNHLIDTTITSAINNNTFDLKDTEIVLDSGEAFSADISPGELIIETDDSIVVKKDDEVVETLTNIIDPARKILNVSDAVEPLGFESGNITSKQVGESWVEIDSVLGVVAVHLAV